MWYAYLHKNGSIQVKRFFDEKDTQEADESPFVKMVIGPFPAENRDEAIVNAKNRFEMIDYLTK